MSTRLGALREAGARAELTVTPAALRVHWN